MVIFSGDADAVQIICASLEGRLGLQSLEESCTTPKNAVTWLALDAAAGMSAVADDLPVLLPSLVPLLILIMIAFVPLLQWLHAADRDLFRRFVTGALLALVLSVPLFVVSIDWGRWFYVHAVSGGLILLLLLARHGHRAAPPVLRLPMVGFAVYLLGWNIRWMGFLIGGGIVIDYGLRIFMGTL